MMNDTGIRNGWSGVGAHEKEHGIQMDDILSDLRAVDYYVFFALLSTVQSELACSSQLFINPPFDTQRRIIPGKEDTCSLF